MYNIILDKQTLRYGHSRLEQDEVQADGKGRDNSNSSKVKSIKRYKELTSAQQHQEEPLTKLEFHLTQIVQAYKV